MKTKTSLVCGSALGALMALALASGAQAQETTTSWKGAPQFSNDGVSFKVRGRVLLDAVFQDIDRETGADFSTRAVRGRQVFLGVEGQLNNYFAYKVEGGAVNGGAWAWDDVVIEYKPTDTASIMFGNIKAAGLENLTSTRFTTFMDRGAFGEIGPDSYVLSAVLKMNGTNWTATGAVQGDTINNADLTTAATNAPDVEERLGFTGRVSFAPILEDENKVHLAAFARYRDHGSEAAFSYATRPNTAFGNRYVNTGAVGDKDTMWGVEGAWVFKNFSVQGEYANIDVDRFVGTGSVSAGADPSVKVGYAFVSFWPTGEMRNYDAAKGEFGRPKILNPVTAGGWGGVELAVRYDYADLSDAYDTASTAAAKTLSQDAGKYTAWTLGVNYYPTPYVRFQANYTKSKNELPVLVPGTGRDVDADTLQFRAQLDF
ncbi:OprO/OprP family phosphate-selective porin [Caulobacter mirabilis]|uniref:Porin n=1 Tax=Caulobacter mirabilis TaxID=69666 RepID=A0A2D2B2Q0_9CAUL|nr:porin [Caulobacter mirabilis]ATQ44533.1 porin [Caulobacter mirabilis]